MKTLRLLTLSLILLLLPGLAVKAQYTIEDTYFSINEKYRFNMPTIGVSLSEMPAYTGFNVDVNDELNTFISLFEENSASYFFNESMLDLKTINVRFSLPNEEQEVMRMSISAKNAAMNFEEFYDMYSTKFYPQQKLKLQAKMGLAYGIRTEYDDEVTEMFFIKYEDFYFIFKYSAENSKFCQSIIKSINSVDFKEKDFEAYHNYLYEDANNESIVKRELQEYKGKAEQPTLVSIPGLGVKMRIPQNSTYDYSSPDVATTNNKNEVIQELNITQNDLLGHTVLFYNFSNKGLYVMYRIWKDMPSPKEQIASDTQVQSSLKKFDMEVDGVTFNAVALGHEEMPTINAYARLNGFSVSLTFMCVEKDVLPIVEEMLNGLAFDAKHKIGAKSNNTTPITELISIKKREIKPQPKITFTKDNISEDKLEAYTLPKQGISFYLPKGVEFISPEELFSKQKSGTKTTLQGSLSDNEFITINSLINHNPTSVSVTLRRVESNLTLEKTMDDIAKSWATYNHVKVVRSGIGYVNDKAWGMIETDTDGTKLIMFFSMHNGIQVMVSGSSQSASDIKLFESLLYRFSFD